MKSKKKVPKVVTLGWRERVSFPDWEVGRLLAKVDTGAKVSSLDVANLEHVSRNRVRFEIVVDDKRGITSHRIEAELVRKASIKPSTGVVQRRIVVRTTVRIGKLRRTIELSLHRRRGMLCRMLLGRTALKHCLVNPSETFLVSKPSLKRDRA